MNDRDQAFGNRLHELREAAGLSQTELAERAGMHRFGIAKLEQGHRQPSWETVKALVMALGIGCDEFLKPAGSGTARRARPAADKPAPKARNPKRPKRGS